MREIRLSGSVEGVVSNHDPYSDSGHRTPKRREGKWTINAAAAMWIFKCRIARMIGR
jgi:hypothetical protein